MEIYVGTSGWSYGWNPAGNLAWYASDSGLNAVELNASFYRFPFGNFVRSWRHHGENLRWSVKVHRSITHHHRFDDHALVIWGRFRERFSPLDELIDFYLFQAPPQFSDLERMEAFFGEISLGERGALEIRDRQMLADDDAIAMIRRFAVPVSVDSPDFRNRIFAGRRVYCRMHGRERWYRHDYSDQELEETA
ncbi:MAG: DUF72 domain-containing protein [Methanomicrobiales archaeon]|nr:DUF72 domain-containing protein [Methanomicrobiales archaeon]